MYTIQAPVPGEPPTLDEAARVLGLGADDLDPEFGVVPVDPQEGLYCVMVEESALPVTSGERARGPFSNPPIGAFGPPEK